MDRISLRAYAKVNFTLDVVGRRSDGYHLLTSIMQSVSLSGYGHPKAKAPGHCDLERAFGSAPG